MHTTSRQMAWISGSFGLASLAAMIAWMSSAHIESELQAQFNICVALFSIATLCFLMLQKERGRLNLADLTCWLTGIFYVEFVLAPWLGSFRDIEDVDESLLPALAVVIIGIMCFWAGMLIWRGAGASRYEPSMQTSVNHRWSWIVGLMCVGLAARLSMFILGLNTYVMSDNYAGSLPYLAAINMLGTCCHYGLILLVIEHHRERSTRTRTMLWGSAGVLVLLGALGGMKEDLALVGLTIIISERLVYERVNWKLLGSCAVLALLFLPISEQYRQDMRSGASAETQRTTNKLVESAQTASNTTADTYLEDAADSAINR